MLHERYYIMKGQGSDGSTGFGAAPCDVGDTHFLVTKLSLTYQFNKRALCPAVIPGRSVFK